MSADDSFPMDQISSLFPQLENIQLVGAKGPQQIFTATLKSNFAPVMLRVVPTEEAGIFGWDPEFIVRSLTIVEQSHQGLLRVYEVGQAGPFTFIISEHPPYPRMADMETLPQISPQAALNLVRNMAEGLTMQGNIHIHILQIMLTGAADADAPILAMTHGERILLIWNHSKRSACHESGFPAASSQVQPITSSSAQMEGRACISSGSR